MNKSAFIILSLAAFAAASLSAESLWQKTVDLFGHKKVEQPKVTSTTTPAKPEESVGSKIADIASALGLSAPATTSTKTEQAIGSKIANLASSMGLGAPAVAARPTRIQRWQAVIDAFRARNVPEDSPLMQWAQHNLARAQHPSRRYHRVKRHRRHMAKPTAPSSRKHAVRHGYTNAPRPTAHTQKTARA